MLGIFLSVFLTWKKALFSFLMVFLLIVYIMEVYTPNKIVGEALCKLPKLLWVHECHSPVIFRKYPHEAWTRSRPSHPDMEGGGNSKSSTSIWGVNGSWWPLEESHFFKDMVPWQVDHAPIPMNIWGTQIELSGLQK